MNSRSHHLPTRYPLLSLKHPPPPLSPGEKSSIPPNPFNPLPAPSHLHPVLQSGSSHVTACHALHPPPPSPPPPSPLPAPPGGQDFLGQVSVHVRGSSSARENVKKSLKFDTSSDVPWMGGCPPKHSLAHPPTRLPALPHACPPAHLPSCPPTCPRARPPTRPPACLPALPPACPPARPPSCLPAHV